MSNTDLSELIEACQRHSRLVSEADAALEVRNRLFQRFDEADVSIAEMHRQTGLSTVSIHKAIGRRQQGQTKRGRQGQRG